VGLNRFRTEEDPHVGSVHRVTPESEKLQISRLQQLKEKRDEGQVKQALMDLKSRAETGEKENLIPVMIEAVGHYATLAEVLGTLRVVMGEPYDPLEVLSHPFF